MKLNYKPIGELVERIDERNTDGRITTLVGVSIDKCFIKSVANTIGTDLTKYKIIKRKDFAVSLMQVSRDEKIPVAMQNDYDFAIMSPAYPIFRVTDENLILPEYLDLWFKRSEFDREAAFIAVGGVRGSMPWEDFCRMEVLVPNIERQHEIVDAYRTITERITLKQQINDNLVATLRALYQKMIVDTQTTLSKHSLSEICSKIGSGATPKGGKESYIEEGIALIRSTNVFDYSFSYSELAHITQEQADALSNVEVEADDVLFNITGVSVTRCCIVPDDVLPARVNQHVMIIRPINGKDMSYYLMFALCDPDNKNKLFGIAQSGSTREAINKQEMDQFQVLLPSDSQIAEFGNIAQKTYAKIKQNTAEIRKLSDMTSILLSQLSSR